MDEWGTPQTFYDWLDKQFSFNLDPCATPENAKCARFFTREQDGLKQDWGGSRVFLNPPYGIRGTTIRAWVEKGIAESQRGATVVMLLPVRADTDWWQNVGVCSSVWFMRNRLYFSAPGGGSLRAPFATCVWVLKPKILDMKLRSLYLDVKTRGRMR